MSLLFLREYNSSSCYVTRLRRLLMLGMAITGKYLRAGYRLGAPRTEAPDQLFCV